MKKTDFITALSTDDLDAIRAVPKTDVHCHAFLSTRRENIERWLGHTLSEPPPKMDGVEGMMEYADAVLAPHIKHREGFEFVAESAMNDAIHDGVVLIEMSFDIRIADFYPNGLEGLYTYIEALVDRYQAQVDLRPELGFSRGCADDPRLTKLAARSDRIGSV